MSGNKKEEIQKTADHLIANFKLYLDVFTKEKPFSQSGQFENHLKTIQRRHELGSAATAVADSAFLKSLHQTLQAWGILVGSRSRLLPLPGFSEALNRNKVQIAAFDGIRIDAVDLDISKVSSELWKLIESLGIVDSDAKLVAGTKA